MSKDKSKCPSCGEVNNSSANFCSACGVKLTTGGSNKKVGRKNQKHNHPDPSSKSLEMKGIYGIVIALLLGGFLVLYFTGVFESHAIVTEGAPQVTEQNPHAGADLSKLQEIRNLELQLAANPNDEVLLSLAHLLNDSGYYDKAILRYNDYLASNPGIPDVIVDMGVCYYQKGDYNNALTSMKRALDIDPKHQIAYFNQGIINLAAQNVEAAKKSWEKAVELNPNNEIGTKAQNLLNTY